MTLTFDLLRGNMHCLSWCYPLVSMSAQLAYFDLLRTSGFLTRGRWDSACVADNLISFCNMTSFVDKATIKSFSLVDNYSLITSNLAVTSKEAILLSFFLGPQGPLWTTLFVSPWARKIWINSKAFLGLRGPLWTTLSVIPYERKIWINCTT